MKIFLVAIGIAAIIAVVISISILTIPNNQLHCTFCPEQHVSNQAQRTSMTSPSITTVIIPPDSEDQSSGKNYEPNIVIVILGVNNTIQWINESIFGNTIAADNHDDPNFWNATHFPNGGIIKQGKSFNFTFTKVGEFGYHGEPHPWLRGRIVALPQSPENAIHTVVLQNSSIPDPCETFRLPCPFNADRNFTALKFGNDIYIEKITSNGVDNYAIVKPDGFCYYPPSYSNSCRNPDDLAILRLVGVDTSIPQEDVNISITGLDSSYLVGNSINFGITVKGYGHCDIPSVLVIHDGVIVWQGKASLVSCPSTMNKIDHKYNIKELGGSFYLNQTGTYTVHVGYSSNMTERQFNVTSQQESNTIPIMYQNATYTGHLIDYNITGYNKVLSSMLDNKSGSIILSTQTIEDGNLTVTLTPYVINLIERGNQENPFIVLTDGQEVKYKEHLYNQNMIMTIPFHSGTKEIEIITTEIV